jgi:fumarate reductase (CoM/CoB) subunit A
MLPALTVPAPGPGEAGERNKGGPAKARCASFEPIMKNYEDKQSIFTDVLIVGGGGAGIRAAIEAARGGCRVIVTNKGPVGRSGITPMAMEAFQCVCTPGDSEELHFRDAVAGERYLGDEGLIAVMVQEARERVRDLESYGVHFKRKPDGSFDPMHHPGQTFPRTLFIQGGGYGLLAGLLAEARKYPEIRILSDTFVVKLCPDREPTPSGAIYLDVKDGGLKSIRCQAVVLATGGYEELWAFTDASVTACGDGVILAYEAGAKLVDLEMVQFYPTVILHPPAIKGTLFQYELIVNPEVLGGRLLNGKEETFFAGMPLRDDVIRAIWKEIQSGRGTAHGGVFIDLTHSRKGRDALTAALEKWQPNQFHYLKDMGVDLRDVMVEAGPHVHFTMGGVAVDGRGCTSVPGLFAAGEVSGNLHGANRISGNSLTETQVFGAIAGSSAAAFAKERGRPASTEFQGEMEEVLNSIHGLSVSRSHPVRPYQFRQRLQNIMWERCGLERDGGGLRRGKADVDELAKEAATEMAVAETTGPYPQEIQEALETRMMLSLAGLVLDSAFFRKETRGHHMRKDYPSSADDPKHTFLARGRGIWEGEVKRMGPVQWRK